MSFVFSVNNKFYGLGRNPAPVFAKAFFDLKEFFKTKGWSISQSGYHNVSFGSDSGSGDRITSPEYVSGGMASDNVWFILRSPDNVRELLFYRHIPIDTSSDNKPGSKISYRTAGIMAIAYSAQSKFSSVIGQGHQTITLNNGSITNVSNGLVTMTFANIGNLVANRNIGNTITVSGNVLSKNNGTFQISAITSSTIVIINPIGATDLSTTITAVIEQPLPISGNNPPMAADMIWFHKNDTLESNFYTEALGPNDIINWSGAQETGDALNDYDIWNMHIGIEDSLAPYPFYFWFTNKRDTLGFFAMDSLLDANDGDPDKVCFWFCPITGGIGGYPTTGMNVLNGITPDTNQWSPHYSDLTANTTRPKRLMAWINKPSAFSGSESLSGRNSFINSIKQNKCRFLNIVVPMLTTYIYDDQPGSIAEDEKFYSFAPSGNTTSLYSDAQHPPQDQLFPIMYFKFASYQSYQEVSNSAAVFDALSLPNMYKGRSSLFKMNSVIRNQFDTLTINTIKDGIICGSSASIVIPWSGVSINK